MYKRRKRNFKILWWGRNATMYRMYFFFFFFFFFFHVRPAVNPPNVLRPT
jgi:hypothetical protein